MVYSVLHFLYLNSHFLEGTGATGVATLQSLFTATLADNAKEDLILSISNIPSHSPFPSIIKQLSTGDAAIYRASSNPAFEPIRETFEGKGLEFIPHVYFRCASVGSSNAMPFPFIAPNGQVISVEVRIGRVSLTIITENPNYKVTADGSQSGKISIEEAGPRFAALDFMKVFEKEALPQWNPAQFLLETIVLHPGEMA